uniref:Saposin A-type domain-containing protein n=1 Tax=Strongyloides papillosus TaxID=174720 RepID=A0A0N5C3D4_STREA
MKILFFIPFLFFTAVLSTPYESFDCAEIPPALWCENDQVKKDCGFDKLCNRYERRMTNQTLKITLLYESLCPDCQEFILGTLHDVYTHFKNYIDLELVPFGNAKIDEKTRKVVCQHGSEECKINKYEGCAINFLQKPFDFIYCLEGKLEKSYNLEKAAPICLEYVKADVHAIDLITHCYNGEQGNKFQKAYAERTLEAHPDKHEHVPWLYFNDISLHKAQTYQSILPQTICQWLVTDSLPDICYKEFADGESVEVSDEDEDEDSESGGAEGNEDGDYISVRRNKESNGEEDTSTEEDRTSEEVELNFVNVV